MTDAAIDLKLMSNLPASDIRLEFFIKPGSENSGIEIINPNATYTSDKPRARV